MNCEECGQSPVVSHQWRLCNDCHKEEMERLDQEISQLKPIPNLDAPRLDENRQMKLPFLVSERLQTIFEATAEEIGRLVAEKQKAYGDSFGKSGAILKILYPDGIRPEQYDDALTITRILDKLFRVATDKDAFGESPWRDVNGYSLLAYIRDQKRGKS